MTTTQISSRVKLPESVALEMKLWRERGCWGQPPQSYIEFHEKLALAALETLRGDFLVHRHWRDGDGWMDGMEVTWAILEHRKTGKLVKIHWHDGNQEFFASHPSGGSTPLKSWEFERPSRAG